VYLVQTDLSDKDHNLGLIRQFYKHIAHNIGTTVELDLLPVADRISTLLHQDMSSKAHQTMADLAELLETYHRRVSLIETNSDSMHFDTRGRVLNDAAHQLAMTADVPHDIGKKDWWIARNQDFDEIYYVLGFLPADLPKESVRKWRHGVGDRSELLGTPIDTRQWIGYSLVFGNVKDPFKCRHFGFTTPIVGVKKCPNKDGY